MPPIPSLSQNSSFLPSGQFGQYLKNIDNIGQLKYSFDVRKISKTDANGNGINPDAFFDTPEAALGEIKLEFIDVLSSNPNGFLEIMSNNLKVSLGIQDVDDLINNIPLIVNKIVKVE